VCSRLGNFFDSASLTSCLVRGLVANLRMGSVSGALRVMIYFPVELSLRKREITSTPIISSRVKRSVSLFVYCGTKCRACFLDFSSFLLDYCTGKGRFQTAAVAM